jgi:hypothetical protein
MINSNNMVGKIVNGVKYIELLFEDNLKNKSLNDWVYYSLQDAHWNAEDEKYSLIVVDLIKQLIKECKNDNNVYTNVIDDANYVKKVYGFLNSLDENAFYFIEEPLDNEVNYIEYNVWFNNLQKLLQHLENLLVQNA